MENQSEIRTQVERPNSSAAPILAYRRAAKNTAGRTADDILAAIGGITIALVMFAIGSVMFIGACALAATDGMVLLAPVVFFAFVVCLAAAFGAMGTAISILKGHHWKSQNALYGASRQEETANAISTALLGVAMLIVLGFWISNLLRQRLDAFEISGAAFVIIGVVIVAIISLRHAWRKLGRGGPP